MSAILEILLLVSTCQEAPAPPASGYTQLEVFSQIRTNVKNGKITRQSFPQLGNGLHIHALALSSDGSLLAGGDAEGTVHVWDLASGRRTARLEGGYQWPQKLAFVLGDRALLDSSWRGPIRMWDLKSGAATRTFDGFTRFAPIAGGSAVAMWSKEGSRFRVLDLASGALLRELSWSDEPVRSMDVSPDGRYLAVAGTSPNHLAMIHLESGETIFRRTVKTASMFQHAMARFSPDGALLLWTIRERDLHVCDSASGHEVASFRTSSDFIPQIDFSPDGRWIGFTDPTANEFLVLDWRTLDLVALFLAKSGSGSFVTLFHPDGKRMFGSANEWGVLVFDMTAAAGYHATVLRSDDSVQSLWGEIASKEAGRSIRAMHALADLGRPFVRYLSQQFSPGLPQKSVPELLKDLDSDEPETRSIAFRSLVRIGKSAEPELRAALERGLSLEVNAAIAGILKELGAPPLPPELVHARLHRALYALERTQEAEALGVLEEISKTGEDCLRRQAAAALLRLSRK
jgi:WD40 repeat protein